MKNLEQWYDRTLRHQLHSPQWEEMPEDDGGSPPPTSLLNNRRRVLASVEPQDAQVKETKEVRHADTARR